MILSRLSARERFGQHALKIQDSVDLCGRGCLTGRHGTAFAHLDSGRLEEARGQNRTDFLCRRGDCGPALVMWLARRYCGMTLREIGEAMGGKDYAAVNDRFRRFERRLASDRSVKRGWQKAVRSLHLETCPFAIWSLDIRYSPPMTRPKGADQCPMTARQGRLRILLQAGGFPSRYLCF